MFAKTEKILNKPPISLTKFSANQIQPYGTFQKKNLNAEHKNIGLSMKQPGHLVNEKNL